MPNPPLKLDLTKSSRIRGAVVAKSLEERDLNNVIRK